MTTATKRGIRRAADRRGSLAPLLNSVSPEGLPHAEKSRRDRPGVRGVIRRPCLECGRAFPVNQLTRGRCSIHRQTTDQRGYGREHQRSRAALAFTLPTHCAYGCGRLLTADRDWVAAHVVDGDPNSARVVSCVRCNERAKGKGGQISAAFRRRMTRAPRFCRLQVPPKNPEAENARS